MALGAKIKIGDHELELPVVVGTEDEVGVDVSSLRAATGAITLDEGFVNTGSTTTRSPISMASAASCGTAATQWSSSRRIAASSRFRTC